MKLFEAKALSKQILKEYATNPGNLFTSFSGKKNTSKTGKKADNIAVGEAKPYKNNEYLTKYEKELPHLAKITQNLKINDPDGSLEVIGPALKELLVLIKAKKPLKVDENGEWILPMGDNIRLVQIGRQYFLKYIGGEDKNKLEPNPYNTEKHDKAVVSPVA